MDWNAISAVATAAATLTALGIATRAELQSRQIAKKMAGLHAASYVAQLTDVVENAHKVSLGLFIRMDFVAAFPKFPILLPARWESAISVLDGDALSRLEALPNNAAYRAAEAIGSLRAIGNELREFENGNAGWDQMDKGVRMSHLLRFWRVFDDAHKMLRAALIDFQYAAKSQIKPLTSEERGCVD